MIKWFVILESNLSQGKEFAIADDKIPAVMHRIQCINREKYCMHQVKD